MSVAGIAVLWPDESNYARFLEISEGKFASTVEGYRATANKQLNEQERMGIRVVRVPFDPEQLLEFARERNGVVDSETRTLYAIWLANEADRPGQRH